MAKKTISNKFIIFCVIILYVHVILGIRIGMCTSLIVIMYPLLFFNNSIYVSPIIILPIIWGMGSPPPTSE